MTKNDRGETLPLAIIRTMPLACADAQTIPRCTHGQATMRNYSENGDATGKIVTLCIELNVPIVGDKKTDVRVRAEPHRWSDVTHECSASLDWGPRRA